MVIPDEFRTFARRFHQDVFLLYPTMTEVIAASAAALRPQQRAVARQFIDELLGGGHTAAEMGTIWIRHADVGPSEEREFPRFFGLLRDALG